MKNKLTISFLLLALIGTNAYWMFVVLDQGITQTYAEASCQTAQKQYEQTVALSNLQLIGLSSKEAIERIGKDVYGLDPFIKGGCIWAGQVCLRLEHNKVSRIGHDAL